MKLKEKNKYVRNNKAITLIALVVTIIILLILAGISIQMLLGESGIISNTKKAKEKSEIAEEQEIAKLAASDALINGNIDEDLLNNSIKNNAGGRDVNVIEDEGKMYVNYKDTDRYYEVKENGTVSDPVNVNQAKDARPGDITTDANGKALAGTETDPYQINCIEDLCGFSNAVNKSKININIHVKLMRDLNFNSIFSYVDGTIVQEGDIVSCSSKEELKDNLTNKEKSGFHPIGETNQFKSVFDGDNHKIENIYINIEKNAGLFGTVNGSVIKNITVSGKITSSSSFAGGIIASGGYNSQSNTIYNCTNYVEVTGYNSSGGIIGHMNTGKNTIVEKCMNYGKIFLSASPWASSGSGGIAGHAESSTIKKCMNYGEVCGVFHCGGISGTGIEVNIEDCKNYGNIYTIGNVNTGGIIGNIRGDVNNILNCSNESSAIIGKSSDGTVIARGSSGGIIGGFGGGSWTFVIELNIKNTSNKGEVYGSTYNGGIIGEQGYIALSTKLTINNCYSVGTINGTNSGAIVGKLNKAGKADTTVSQLITNTYYKQGIADTAIKDGICTNEAGEEVPTTITALTEAYMKGTESNASIEKTFVQLLNTNSTQGEWVKGEDDYPEIKN